MDQEEPQHLQQQEHEGQQSEGGTASMVIGGEVEILETVEDIQSRREQVLSRYAKFRADALSKRQLLEDSRRFQYFKRDADELEAWILEKLQAASDESYKDPTNLQVRPPTTAIRILQIFRAIRIF